MKQREMGPSLLMNHLRFVYVSPTTKKNGGVDERIPWPCLHFENEGVMISALVQNKILHKENQKFKQRLEANLFVQSRNHKTRPSSNGVAFLLGKILPVKEYKAIVCQEEVLDFLQNSDEFEDKFGQVEGFASALAQATFFVKQGSKKLEDVDVDIDDYLIQSDSEEEEDVNNNKNKNESAEQEKESKVTAEKENDGGSDRNTGVVGACATPKVPEKNITTTNKNNTSKSQELASPTEPSFPKETAPIVDNQNTDAKPKAAEPTHKVTESTVLSKSPQQQQQATATSSTQQPMVLEEKESSAASSNLKEGPDHGAVNESTDKPNQQQASCTKSLENEATTVSSNAGAATAAADTAATTEQESGSSSDTKEGPAEAPKATEEANQESQQTVEEELSDRARQASPKTPPPANNETKGMEDTKQAEGSAAPLQLPEGSQVEDGEKVSVPAMAETVEEPVVYEQKKEGSEKAPSTVDPATSTDTSETTSTDSIPSTKEVAEESVANVQKKQGSEKASTNTVEPAMSTKTSVMATNDSKTVSPGSTSIVEASSSANRDLVVDNPANQPTDDSDDTASFHTAQKSIASESPSQYLSPHATVVSRTESETSVKRPSVAEKSNPASRKKQRKSERMKCHSQTKTTPKSSTRGRGAKTKMAPLTSSQRKNGKVIPEQEKVKIPKFTAISRILGRFDYVFADGKYRTPAIGDGPWCFDNEEDFRNYLCALNIVYADPSKVTEQEKKKVREWVRYSIVEDPNEYGKHFPLDSHEAWSLLKEIGFSHSNGLYNLPVTEKPKRRKEGVDCFNWDGDEGLKAYLARHGLPKNCDFDAIDKLERLSLECFLTEELELEFCDGKRRRSCTSTGFIASNQPAKKPKVSMSGRQRKKRSVTAVDNSDSQSLVSEGPSLGVAPSTPLKRNPSKSRVSLSPLGKVTSPALPDTMDTCKDKMESCLQLVNQQAPNGLRNLDVTKGTSIASNMKEILRFLHSVVESEGRNSGSEGDATALYVCGGPGVGKTSAILWCCEKVIAEYMNKSDDTNCLSPIKVCINANGILAGKATPTTVRSELSKALGVKSGATSKDKIKKHLNTHRQVLFLVLDEVDALVRGATGGAEKEFQTLMDWANDVDFPMALIGISNTTGSNEFERLQNAGTFNKNLVFERYSTEELVHILKARVGVSTVAEPVFKLIANKVASTSGDARKAFDMLSEVIKKCMDSTSEPMLLETASGPIVVMKHLQLVLREQTKYLPVVVASLPQAAKSVLCVVTALLQGKAKKITASSLKNLSIRCLNSLGTRIDSEDFFGLLQTLQDEGLLSTEGTNFNKLSHSELLSHPICLGMQLEDVVKAVEDELCKSTIFDRVRKMVEQNGGWLD